MAAKIFTSIQSRFWNGLHSLHLYSSKGESLAKTFVITFSWYGSVYSVLTRDSAVFLLFSMAMIVEYGEKVLRAQTFLRKLLPLIIGGTHTVMFFLMVKNFFLTVQHWNVGQPPPSIADFNNLCFLISVGTIVLLWLDAGSMVVLPEPHKYRYTEASLKDLRVKGY